MRAAGFEGQKALDPGGFALKGAVRAAIVLPVAFALGDVVLGNDAAGLFAAFGSMALLVLVEFGGSTRTRLGAYVALVAVGAGLIALGTLCSDSTVLGTVVMLVLAFGIMFAGVLNGYVAAAQTAAILVFVLPLMVPAGADQIPSRLLGWVIAGVLAISAVFLIWPQRPRSVVRGGAARAARALAELVEADPGSEAERARAAETAIAATRADFVTMQHRPSGTGGRTAALARLIEDLAWVYRHARVSSGEAVPALAESRAAIERWVPVVLRSTAGLLDGTVALGAGPADQGSHAQRELRRAHGRLGDGALAEMTRLAAVAGGEQEAARQLDEVFRLRLLSFSAVELEVTARRALGAPRGGGIAVARSRLGAARRLARAHASMRSVWLRNSLRGAIGLALAVLVAQLADVQNAFWVVLGTLSVLRSSALATGSRIGWALLGTFGGIVVGGLLVAAVDSDPTALWIMLPFATALAAYTPRAISFAAGQAGFSVVVLVLFNLINPAGWEVGLLRIEDVAIGAGISLLVGALLWPRGAAAVVRRSFGAAYLRAAEFLDETLSALLAGRPPSPEVAREAFAAGQVLDGGVRDYLSERSGAGAPIEELAVLMIGATRVREVAELLIGPAVLVRLEPVDPSLPRVEAARRRLETERDRRCGWFAALGRALAADAAPPEPQAATPGIAAVVLEGGDTDHGSVPPGLALAWAQRYLEALRVLEQPLARAAAR